MKRRNIWPAVLATAALLALANVSYAQFGGGPPPGRGPGGPGGGRGFGGGRRGGGGMFLLRTPEVQKELGLTQAQIKKLEALPRPGGGGGGQSFQNMTEEQRRKAFADMRKQREKQLASVLNAKQMARLHQLELQRAGYHALGEKEVADKLKLTADQRKRVDKVMATERDALRKLGESMRGGSPGGGGRGGFEQFQKQRTATENALKGILTGGQKTQFAAMMGKPFKFPPPQFGRGGRGGPGGGGRGPGGGGRPGGRPGTAT